MKAWRSATLRSVGMRNCPQNCSGVVPVATLVANAGAVRSGPHNPKSKNDGLALAGMAELRGTPVA